MKKLLHFTTSIRCLQWFNNDWTEIEVFLKKHNLNGIEIGLYPEYSLQNIPKNIVEGMHLSFYPEWLELDQEPIIASYKLQYQKAKQLKSKYMVFHVSHVKPTDTFTWKFDYTDEVVVDATIDLLNNIFPEDEDGPMLLFENLWWPGLTFLNKTICQKLLDKVKYKNKGFVLDISHLILMNKNIDNEAKAYTFIKKVMNDLKELKSYFKVIHINKTLPKHYMSQNHSFKLENYKSAKDDFTRKKILLNHIKKLDPHVPFDSPLIKDIIKLVDPEFCVYEVNPQNIYELNYFIKTQNTFLK
ncbi:hypothetical protein AN639_12780 [Candidatus Epulonipiscium fishelsonii]|uniref:Uncharacterized protein n=1 Tax=Candidatus Epulonipiscium fishelsonii TaxID=77094 RepID=A0ACC8XCJ9_9FIRM|nr:hypothetical protein AN396_06255 [Epulopiscium sp. SCG-B11WGA-EpuloA1]ONI42226.1 hypothetical protein AN639_12780 [Epulopiscium sp. SCG-B05WGA-EpuloA1]